MTREHADFYVGTGPDARWLGALANVGGPVEPTRLGAAGDADTAEVLSAADRDQYRRPLPRYCLASEPSKSVSSPYPGPAGEAGWPWLATRASCRGAVHV